MNSDLLGDLAGYKSYKDKSVMMATRSLIQLFRTVNPELLARKDKVCMVCAERPHVCSVASKLLIRQLESSVKLLAYETSRTSSIASHLASLAS